MRGDAFGSGEMDVVAAVDLCQREVRNGCHALRYQLLWERPTV